jgi:tellurite resistance protein TehA-like permease
MEALKVQRRSPAAIGRASMTGLWAVGPEAGGAVMATGIVSIAIQADGQKALSRALLVIATVAWVLLGGLFLVRLRHDRDRWRDEAARPAALTGVAATAVLGARLTELGWSSAGWALLALATILYVALLSVWIRERSVPSVGVGFLLVVAPESLAVLAAALGHRAGTTWPALAALVPFVAGLGAYPVVLAHFDARAQLRFGAGDQWVSGGALAISTLACARIAEAMASHHALAGLHATLRIASVVLCALTIAWLPVLLGAETRSPRPSYDVRRWATVFPLGMYSVMSVATGYLTGVRPLVTFGEVWAWVALAAWAVTTLGATKRR